MNIVITSYSIHYTKLYDLEDEPSGSSSFFCVVIPRPLIRMVHQPRALRVFVHISRNTLVLGIGIHRHVEIVLLPESPVLTSYHICMVGNMHFKAVDDCRNGDSDVPIRLGRENDMNIVITSYSIHYTKLYEFHREPRNGSSWPSASPSRC